VLPLGRQIARVAGAGLIVYGAVVVFVPEALPMTMDDDHSTMSEMDEMNQGGMDSPAEMDEMGEPAEMGEMEGME
jgi:hypothetical protein